MFSLFVENKPKPEWLKKKKTNCIFAKMATYFLSCHWEFVFVIWTLKFFLFDSPPHLVFELIVLVGGQIMFSTIFLGIALFFSPLGTICVSFQHMKNLLTNNVDFFYFNFSFHFIWGTHLWGERSSHSLSSVHYSWGWIRLRAVNHKLLCGFHIGDSFQVLEPSFRTF